MSARALQQQSPLYIGPWQEFALGRALQPPAGRRHGRRRAPAEATPSDPELANFMDAFKDLAGRMDEEGAKNLLRLSPLFLPTMQGLLHPGAPIGPSALEPPVGTRQRAQAAVGASVGGAAKLTDAQLPAASERRRGGNNVKAQRQERVQRLQQMYSCSGAADSALPTHAEPSVDPAVNQWGVTAVPQVVMGATTVVGADIPLGSARCYAGCGGRTSPTKAVWEPRPSDSPPMSRNSIGVGSLGDEWEDEVDGLLEWTRNLQSLA